MGYVIAIAGKGGTGKTTIAALIVRMLKEEKKGSVLAVDADPNSNLAEVLGFETKESVGAILDNVARHPEKIPQGMPKERFLEYQIQTAIEEAQGYDMLTMGKPEGPGCYCYVNNVLRGVLSKLINDYDYIVIDNEAGLEHLSRRTTRSADLLLVVSDTTAVGLKAAGRISTLADELEIKTKRRALLVNRCKDGVTGAIKVKGLEHIGNLPYDSQIEKVSMNGGSLMDLRRDATSIFSLRAIGEFIWRCS